MLTTLGRAFASRVPAVVACRHGLKRARSVSRTRAEAMSRTPSARIEPSTRVRVWVCDIQEKFSSVVTGFDHVAHNASTLLRALDAMHDPDADSRIIMTEQVPEKLGSTVASVVAATQPYDPGRVRRVSKTAFSMYDGGKEFIDDASCAHVVVGLEAHVCVLQTVLDLLRKEPESAVYVCVDAVSSIRLEDRAVALRRMERAGAILTCTESVIFEKLADASDSRFRSVSKIVREGASNKPTSAPLPSI
jgi:hypothetical protein